MTAAIILLLISIPIPLLAVFIAVRLDAWRSREVSAPQKEKLLRPAGYSLSLKLDRLHDAAQDSWLLCLLASYLTLTSVYLAYQTAGIGLSPELPVYFAGIAGIAAYPAYSLIQGILRNAREAKCIRLGMRGEQAVAEALNEVADAGYRAFHDLQPEGTWNIDHVIVGTRGVFLIETKARRKYASEGQARHVVIYEGSLLNFPNRSEKGVIEQVSRNVNWLTDFVAKKTAEVTPVQGLVVIPGWYVESKGNYPIKVMNANYLVSYLRKQAEILDPTQVRRIIAALDDQCRTLSF